MQRFIDRRRSINLQQRRQEAPDKPPVDGLTVESLAVLAEQIDIYVRHQEKTQLEFILRSFAELKKMAEKYWTEMYGEDLFNNDNPL